MIYSLCIPLFSTFHCPAFLTLSKYVKKFALLRRGGVIYSVNNLSNLLQMLKKRERKVEEKKRKTAQSLFTMEIEV